MAVFEGNFTQDPSSLRFALVISRFNDLVTDKLLAGCQDCLKRHGIDVDPHGRQVDYLWVPGSFEVPMIARKVAFSGRYDAVICLGAIIRGQTPHFDHVASEAAKGIANAAFETGVPVIFGILTTETMQQALERAGIKSNHGWNYAMNALEMANLIRQINGSISGSRTDSSSYDHSGSVPSSTSSNALGEKVAGSLPAGSTDAQISESTSAQNQF